MSISPLSLSSLVSLPQNVLTGQNANVENDPKLNATTATAPENHGRGANSGPDIGAKLMVVQNDMNSRISVESNRLSIENSRIGSSGILLARGGQITCSDDPNTEQQCRNAGPPVVRLADKVPNISVAPGTYQGDSVGLGVGVKNGDKTAGFSQQDARWGDKDYKWAPGVPLTGWKAQNGKWRDIGCTATAFTNGVRAVNPNSGVTPANAAALDNKFWDAVGNTRFTDLSGQGKSINLRNLENFTNGLTGYQQGPKIEQIEPVKVDSSKGKELISNIRESVQQRNPVLVGFRNADGSQIRHTSLAVGYDKGQLQILDSETGKVMPMDKFLNAYGYNDAKFDYAYAMSAK